MSRGDLQVNFRLPVDLKDRLEAAAKANKRTLTAELISLLESALVNAKGAAVNDVSGDGGAAFPVPSDGRTHGTEWGMSLRQYFAIRCPFSLIFNSQNAPQNITPEMLAKIAYEFADAMLKEGEVQS